MQLKDFAKLKSVIPEIRWPAIPSPAGANLLAMQYQLEQSQWWPPSVLGRQQMAQLATLLVHAFEHVPFYRNTFENCGFDPYAEFSYEDFAGLPLLTRTEIQKQSNSLRSASIPPSHGKITETRTSGSTGTPVHCFGTEVTHFFWHAFTLRDHFWHKRNLDGKLAAIRKLPASGHMTGWGVSTSAVFDTGPCSRLKINTPLAEQVKWLEGEQPDYLLSFASNLKALAQYFRANNRVLPGLKEVRSVGEVVTPELRELCRQVWGVPLVDIYSAQEVGYIALQCPACEHYHVQSESLLVEILDEQGRVCIPGSVGKVVVTTLHNFAMPLIRYEIGDCAEPGDKCPCGRGLPVLNRIIGRVRNMLILPSGDKRWPFLGHSSYRDIAPVRQCQIVQENLERITVNLVTERPLSRHEEEQLRALILSRLGHAFDLGFVYHKEITRDLSGKFEDFYSKIE